MENAGITTLKHWVSRYIDRRRGVDTVEEVEESELGYDPALRVGYDASRWLTLRAVLPRGEVSGRDVFADLGSGKGRVVLQAARHYAFKRVIGVELSPELNAIASANLRANRHQLRCPQVEFLTADASDWLPPEDLTIAYLFNPFLGQVFSRAMERLVELVDRRGLPLRVIYVNPKEHGRLMQTGRAAQLDPPGRLRLKLAGIPSDWVNRYELRPQR